jgi:hypothetical protein
MYATAQEMRASYHAIRTRLYGDRWSETAPEIVIEPEPFVMEDEPERFKYERSPVLYFAPLHMAKRPAIVMTTFCRVSGMTREQVWQHCRAARVGNPRAIAWRLLREFTGMSWLSIAKLGGFDHTSVLYGVQRSAVLVKSKPEMRVLYETARAHILAVIAKQNNPQFVIDEGAL